MGHSTTASLRAALVPLGVDVVHAQDPRPRAGAYISIEEEVSLTLDRDGDFGDLAAEHGATEEAQVDLWQYRRDASGRVVESVGLAEAVIAALHGAQLTSDSGRIYGCRVVASARLPEQNNTVTHHAITVELRRSL